IDENQAADAVTEVADSQFRGHPTVEGRRHDQHVVEDFVFEQSR
ncbi:MAG: hypothetical protein JWO57_3027, partial [Pseudonocardiales bacterium]|nr:hypothetical protein [Pseudonocardiales bacterium]